MCGKVTAVILHGVVSPERSVTSVWSSRSGKCWLHAPCTMLGVGPAPGDSDSRLHSRQSRLDSGLCLNCSSGESPYTIPNSPLFSEAASESKEVCHRRPLVGLS